MTAAVSRTIVATGGHSGLGLEALKALLDSPFAAGHCRLILYARDPAADHCQIAKNELLQRAASSSSRQRSIDVDLRPMDLASLSSVRNAADVLRKELEADKSSFVDIFLMNAALAKANKELVSDEQDKSGRPDRLKDEQARYETTACVNHVSHLLFLKRLEPVILRLAQGSHDHVSQRTRIVFTGSALHRSLKETSALDMLFSSSAHEGATQWDLMKSYGSSKFLQALGIRAYRRKLAELLSKDSSSNAAGVEVLVVQPGFVPQTGLSRESGWLSRLAMAYIVPWFPFATSLEQAGQWIARACWISLQDGDEGHGESDPIEQDGWSSAQGLVRAALLQKTGSKQVFGTLDTRTAEVALQDQWWPTVCDDT